MAVLINYLAMIVRVSLLTPRSSLMPHFAFNVAYIVFVPVCSFFIFKNMKKTELSKRSRLFCVLSCIVALVLAALMLLWEFYK